MTTLVPEREETKHPAEVDCRRVRDACLHISVLSGSISHLMLGIRRGVMGPHSVVFCSAYILKELTEIARLVGFDFVDAVELKQKMNELRYPVAECSGNPNMAKSSAYHELTGIDSEKVTETLGEELSRHDVPHVRGWLTPDCNIAEFTAWAISFGGQSASFSEKRGWGQYDRDYAGLFFAMQCEIGELCDSVRLLGDGCRAVTREQLGQISSETSDVFIYLLRMCKSMGVLAALLEQLACFVQTF